MQPIIKDIILSISDDVVSNLTQSFEKTYYGKMNYSSKNTILDSDNKLLKETIGFEIAFIHVITYFLAYSMSCSHEYMHILNILDTDKLFSWFKIKDNSMFLQLNDCNIPTEKEIYELINEHDKFIDKDVKKKLGQFYTPTGIAKKMVFEVRNELKDLSERDLVVDPACGREIRKHDSTIYAVLLTNYELDDFADQFGDYDYELQKSEITSRYKDVAEKIKRACGLRKENLMYRAVEIKQQQDTETIRLLQEISSKLDEKK